MKKGKLVGQGRTSKIFAWGEKHILKLFEEDIPDKAIENEFRASRVAFDQKISTPYAEDIIEVEGRKGIIYELIDGVTMMKYLSSRPWLITRNARRLADVHYLIHKTKVSGLVDQKLRLKEKIYSVKFLTVEKKKFIIEYLELLNSGNSLCHGDFHPDNILIANDKEIVIDWMTGVMGNSVSDVARTCLLLSMGTLPENISFIMKRIINFARSKFYSEYIKQYLKISGTKMEEVEKWMLPVAAARINEGIPEEKDQLLKIVDEQLEALSLR